MIVPVWLAYKKGEPRIYARTTCPPDDLAQRWKEQGFTLYRAEVPLPVWDSAGIQVHLENPAEEVE